jgi:hypothetical protein
MIEQKLTVPTVHLNGTSKDTLLHQLHCAKRNLKEAIEKLGNTEPHGRDYYMHGREAFHSAQAQHVSRLERLTSVYDELSELEEKISEQGVDTGTQT